MRVYAYELLFRNSSKATESNVVDGDQATTKLILNTFSDMGLEHVVGNKYAFINLTGGAAGGAGGYWVGMTVGGPVGAVIGGLAATDGSAFGGSSGVAEPGTMVSDVTDSDAALTVSLS